MNKKIFSFAKNLSEDPKVSIQVYKSGDSRPITLCYENILLKQSRIYSTLPDRETHPLRLPVEITEFPVGLIQKYRVHFKGDITVSRSLSEARDRINRNHLFHPYEKTYHI